MLKLNKLNLKLRLVAGFSIVPIIMIVLNVIGVNEVNLIDKELYNINEVTSVKQRYAINFRGSVHDRAISIRDVILSPDPIEVKKSEDEIIVLADFYKVSAEKLDVIFSTQYVTSEEKQLLNEIKDIENKTLPIIEKTLKAKRENRLEDAQNILMNEAKPAFITWLARINKFIDYQEKINTIDATAARKTASGYQNLMLLLTGLSLITAIVLSFFVIRSILTLLKRVASDIDDSSKKISSVSEIISDSGKHLADGSNKQATSIDKISCAINEMDKTFRQNAEVSTNASQLAIDCRNSAKKGEKVVQEMVGAIGEINDSNTKIMIQIDESNRQISEIVKVISEIGDKTKIINDIVFQTKLLSFNASVEAARAGEHGKGFAVVAEEVGKLAQMSGDAAKEISDMLSNSISKVESIVSETKNKVSSLIDSGKEKIHTGNVVAKQCAEVLQDIVVKVNSVTEMATEISGSLKDQSVGFSNISENIFEMEKVIQINSGLASENADTINSLNEQTIEMRNAYDELSRLVDGEEKSSLAA